MKFTICLAVLALLSFAWAQPAFAQEEAVSEDVLLNPTEAGDQPEDGEVGEGVEDVRRCRTRICVGVGFARICRCL